MVINFSGWVLIVGGLLTLAVLIWLAAVEEREDKFEKRNAQMSKAQRRRIVQDAVQHRINENWRNAE